MSGIVFYEAASIGSIFIESIRNGSCVSKIYECVVEQSYAFGSLILWQWLHELLFNDSLS